MGETKCGVHTEMVSGRRVAERVVFGGFPLAVLFATIVASIHAGSFAVDFDSVLPEIRGLAHGTSPYVAGRLVGGGHYLWSIFAGLILSPLAWLPHPLGDGVFTLVQVVSLGVSLWFLDVRDWRVYGVVLAWPATVNSVQTANLTLPTCALLALAWHERDRGRCGVWVGIAVALKFFAWPTLVWICATRRWKALGWALLVQVVGLLVALPYISLSHYIDFERGVADAFQRDSLTLQAVLEEHGLSHRLAFEITLLLGLVVLALGRRDLGACAVAALILTPVAWLHYFDLLLVPLGVWRSAFWIWLAPLLLVIAPGEGNGAPWQAIGTLSIAAAAVVLGRSFRTVSSAQPDSAISPVGAA